MNDSEAAWLFVITMMERLAKKLPDDFMMLGAIQSLAEAIVEISPLITKEQEAVLMGVGALMVREGKAEVLAGIRAQLALEKAKGGPLS